MDAAYISAFAALAGTVIGGLTSFTTSWMTQHSQARTQRLASERERREALFGRFIEEAAKLYADALQNKRDDTSAMIGIYALISRIRLTSSAPVVEKAEIVARIIFDAYLAPNLTLEEVRMSWVYRYSELLRNRHVADRAGAAGRRRVGLSDPRRCAGRVIGVSNLGYLRSVWIAQRSPERPGGIRRHRRCRWWPSDQKCY
jgi:hypothetical protein